MVIVREEVEPDPIGLARERRSRVDDLDTGCPRRRGDPSAAAAEALRDELLGAREEDQDEARPGRAGARRGAIEKTASRGEARFGLGVELAAEQAIAERAGLLRRARQSRQLGVAGDAE